MQSPRWSGHGVQSSARSIVPRYGDAVELKKRSVTEINNYIFSESLKTLVDGGVVIAVELDAVIVRGASGTRLIAARPFFTRELDGHVRKHSPTSLEGESSNAMNCWLAGHFLLGTPEEVLEFRKDLATKLLASLEG